MSVIMKDNTAPIKLPISIILDGKIIYRNLSSCGLSRKGVKALLEEKGIRGNDIFWMYYSEGEIKTIMKDEKS